MDSCLVPPFFFPQLWQAFVGVQDCRVNTYYQELLASNQNGYYGEKCDNSISETTNSESSTEPGQTSEKWKGQIEKDLLRTFLGHPTLDEDGRNALRRLLTAYAWHNPSVGYYQVKKMHIITELVEDLKDSKMC